MPKPTKKEIIKSLNLQKEIFGDDLFISKKKRNIFSCKRTFI